MSKKIHLITVLGTSPAVITETLYAMYKNNEFPSKITVFTTLTGKGALGRDITDKSDFKSYPINQAINELCVEYKIKSELMICDKNIVVIKDENGNELEDIKSQGDQKAMADQLCEKIREYTSDNDFAVHASIAGGRKSMSFFLGYIFSLFARPDDKLSHVLVTKPKLEGTDFMYPPKIGNWQCKEYTMCRNEKITTVTVYPAEVDDLVQLAEIPFVPLTQYISSNSRKTFLGYTEELNIAIAKDIVEWDRKNHIVTINGEELKLDSLQYAFYTLLLEDCMAGEYTYCHNFEKDFAGFNKEQQQEYLCKESNFRKRFLNRLSEKVVGGKVKFDDLEDKKHIVAMKELFDRAITRSDTVLEQLPNNEGYVFELIVCCPRWQELINRKVKQLKIKDSFKKDIKVSGRIRQDSKPKTKAYFYGLGIDKNRIQIVD